MRPTARITWEDDALAARFSDDPEIRGELEEIAQALRAAGVTAQAIIACAALPGAR